MRFAAPEEVCDHLVLDPAEGRNVAADPANADVVADLRGRLERWMVERSDPLLDGPVAPPPGAQINDQDQVSPGEPTQIITADPTAAPSR